jgi:CxxC-x17-CxxC domain-containing protein
MAEFRRKSGSRDRGSGRSEGRTFKRRESGGRREQGGFARRSSGRSGGRGYDRPEKTTVTCDSCKQKCEVPFKPTSNKPVYCDDCFRNNSGSRSNDSNKGLEEINQKLDKIMKALKIND